MTVSPNAAKGIVAITTEGDAVFIQADTSGNLSVTGPGGAAVDTELASASTASDNDTNESTAPVRAWLMGKIVGSERWARITSTLINADHRAIDVNEQSIPVARDNTNGVIAVAQKPLTSASYAVALYRNAAAASTFNIKATAGVVYAVSCDNLNVAARWLQLWDSASTAGNGTIKLEFMVPGLSQIMLGINFFTQFGVRFDVGIAFGYSTTRATYTAGTANEQHTQVLYL